MFQKMLSPVLIIGKRIDPVHLEISERSEHWAARWKAVGSEFERETFINEIKDRHQTTIMSLETSLAIQDDLEYEKWTSFLKTIPETLLI